MRPRYLCINNGLGHWTALIELSRLFPFFEIKKDPTQYLSTFCPNIEASISYQAMCQSSPLNRILLYITLKTLIFCSLKAKSHARLAPLGVTPKQLKSAHHQYMLISLDHFFSSCKIRYTRDTAPAFYLNFNTTQFRHGRYTTLLSNLRPNTPHNC